MKVFEQFGQALHSKPYTYYDRVSEKVHPTKIVFIVGVYYGSLHTRKPYEHPDVVEKLTVLNLYNIDFAT